MSAFEWFISIKQIPFKRNINLQHFLIRCLVNIYNDVKKESEYLEGMKK